MSLLCMISSSHASAANPEASGIPHVVRPLRPGGCGGADFGENDGPSLQRVEQLRDGQRRIRLTREPRLG